MTILFIVHETGRTNALVAAATNLLKENPQQNVIFFAVGRAAKDVLSQIPENSPLKGVQVFGYGDVFSDAQTIEHLDDHPLSDTQLNNVMDFINAMTFEKVIIGAPSWLNAHAPFQIASRLSAITPESGFIYDGDFYKEEGCAYWSYAEKPDTEEFAWRKKFTWLASLPKSKELMPKLTPGMNVEVVGDPNLDKAIDANPLSQEDIAAIRKDLQVEPAQELLLVAGSKYLNEDQDQMIQILEQKPDNHFQIRVLLHRGCKDFDTHIKTYFELIKKYSADNLKILIAGALIKSRVNPHLCDNKNVLVTHHDPETFVKAADRLSSTIPGTPATQAAIRGIPVYCHLIKHISYLPDGRINVGEQGLAAFLKKDRQKQAAYSRNDLGLSKLSVIAINHFLTKKLNSNLHENVRPRMR